MNEISFAIQPAQPWLNPINLGVSFVLLTSFGFDFFFGWSRGVENSNRMTKTSPNQDFSIRSRSVITHSVSLILLSARYYVMRPPKSRSLTSQGVNLNSKAC